MAQKARNKARQQGPKISTEDVIDMAASRIAAREAAAEVTAHNEEEKRLVRKLLARLRVPRPRSESRVFRTLIENVLDIPFARGEPLDR